MVVFCSALFVVLTRSNKEKCFEAGLGSLAVLLLTIMTENLKKTSYSPSPLSSDKVLPLMWGFRVLNAHITETESATMLSFDNPKLLHVRQYLPTLRLKFMVQLMYHVYLECWLKYSIQGPQLGFRPAKTPNILVVFDESKRNSFVLLRHFPIAPPRHPGESQGKDIEHLWYGKVRQK